MEETILVERRQRTWLFTLNRPERLNSVNAEMSRAMNRLLTEFDEDEEALVAVITGAGERAFSTGADLKEIVAGGLSAIVDVEPGGFAGVRHPRAKPVIAAVNGLALGGGFEIAIACDLIVAAETAEFGLPEVTRGFIAGAGGLQRLPRLIGSPRAMEAILTGSRIAAPQAYELGLVTAVVPAAEVLPRALELARRIEANAPIAVRESRAVARLAAAATEDAAWERTGAAWEAVLASDDYAEGVAAFTEKRPPSWTGR
jgi:crotonobetainyl-CoA hydratase